MSDRNPFDDPVPRSVSLSLDEVFRVLEAIEDARLALRERGAASDDGEPMWVSKNGEGLEPVAPLRQRQSRWRSGFDPRLFRN